jgi:hypothetical protein
MTNIGARKFGGSPHHAQHVDVPGAGRHPVQQVDYLLYRSYLINIKYLIKYGCFGNQFIYGVYPKYLCRRYKWIHSGYI